MPQWKCAEMKIASLVLFVLAGAGVLLGGYLYTFCVPLEASCHLGVAASCERLEATLRASMWTAIGAVACGALGLVLRRLGSRARERPQEMSA